nr:acetylxylan esterase [uncultured Flavobacterium sp.]
MKKTFLVAFLFLLLPKAGAQTSDSNFREPIAKTINKIASIFKVSINDKDGLLKGKELDYAEWRIRQGNLDVSLTAILAPFDLTFFKENNSTYVIRKFEYARTSDAVGKERLEYLADLYPNLKAWESRKADLKQCIISSIGLDKAPPMPKGKPILTPKRIYKDYSVENIGLEIIPGVYVTGSIYKPYPLKGKAPVVITPNGHFGDGRYRKDQQYRCAILAKMGAVVVDFDLFAWGESTLQFESTLHRSSIAQTIQVLSAERLLDYLATQKYADMNRVAATGGSGGGSQTMFLAAIDDRIKVSVPVVMTSSHFAGGCPCESGRGLHLCGNGTNNAEIAAMAAPKPQLIVSDGGDWTATVPELEFPFIQKTYGLYGKQSLVENVHFPKEGHNYGESKRMAMYPFMAKYLGLDINKVKNSKGEIDESTCVIEPTEKLLVFGAKGEKLPANALKDINQLYALFGEKNEKVYEVKK